MTDTSATRSPWIPRTRSHRSVTAAVSVPILQVPILQVPTVVGEVRDGGRRGRARSLDLLNRRG
jgi:hypothetical protein